MCYWGGTYIYMWNQTHIWDNRNDDTEPNPFMNDICTYNHRNYVWCAYYVVAITHVMVQCAVIILSLSCSLTSIAWYPGVCLVGAYLRKVLAAQRKTYLHRQERVLHRPPPPAALNSSEECSGSRSPSVAEAEQESGPDAPTSRSQTCGRRDAT